MINWKQARQLQDDVGKEEMEEVVELFLSEVDEAIETLEREYPGLTADERAAAFHFLKGCASNLGFEAFGNQCAKGEEITNAGQVPDFEIFQLVEIYTSSKQHFAENSQAELG